MSLKAVSRTVLQKLGIYEETKKIILKGQAKRRLTNNYKFENRMKNKDKVCIILAGYKEFLYETIFTRIKKFVPDDVEVCILSSGKYSEKLSIIAKENDWSYLSTKRNNVALIQNVAIHLFKNAEYIYKLDEDMFITKGFFETLMKTLKHCEEYGEYKVGFVAPTIPINGFGCRNVLKRFNLLKVYEEKFERPYYALEDTGMLRNSPEVAKFLWGGTTTCLV